jgi:tetratricopeptide (TPR) repeat protein
MNKKIQILIAFLLLIVVAPAQNYFKFYKNGETFYKEKKYQEAVDEFTKVVEQKTTHDRAYNYRGLSFVALNKDKEAVSDFKKAIDLKAKNAEYHFNLGEAYFHLLEYDNAHASYSLAIKYDKKMTLAYEKDILSLIKLKDYETAVTVAKEANLKEKTANNYYYQALAQDSLKDYSNAANSFSRAIFYSSKMKKAYVGLAHANMMLEDYEKALTACEKGLKIEGDNTSVLLMRSEIYLANRNPQSAVGDLSLVVAQHPKKVQYYLKRGSLYQKIGQHQNAIADFSKAITINDTNYTLYYLRGQSYEELVNYKAASKDYSRIAKFELSSSAGRKIKKDAAARLHKINKETDNPKIVMIDPLSPKEGVVGIPKGAQFYTIKGQIIDASHIDFIKINGKDAEFNKDTINPFFELEIILKETKELIISAFDTYQNSETWIFKIQESEIDSPIIKLMAPYASDDGTIYLDTDDPSLYIEGIISDESLIKSILIEESTASFSLDKNNPTFSATINIMNKDNFTVTAIDVNGNKSVKKFIIDRENVGLLADNPMGKTWVVFIENSNYQSFASLDGPTKDVTMMKSAFAKYKINNVVHKKNMSKKQLERFFSIELRDLVRSNRVNSLLVWYAGHGKFINETGYWVPTDAKRDDEFTYFNINNLKAAMQSYSKFITHTLVVTDACESGPSFYQAMRSTPKAKSCNDWKATKFKSSQVFSSAGYELATDNSQFTKTFATSLSSNPNSCIPIETIVTKVKSAVGKGGKQKPKFGKIAGLEDENGTFFFIKK